MTPSYSLLDLHVPKLNGFKIQFNETIVVDLVLKKVVLPLQLMSKPFLPKMLKNTNCPKFRLLILGDEICINGWVFLLISTRLRYILKVKNEF